MGVSDWNWTLPADPQDYPWDCAACSTAWAMRTVGFEVTEQDVISGLGPDRISPTYGLLDASGAGLVSYLEEQGIAADNDAESIFDEVLAAAGYQPMVIGGRGWNHWVAVRMGGDAAGRPELRILALMNSSPGWMNVGQSLSESQFRELGPFSAVWFTSW